MNTRSKLLTLATLAVDRWRLTADDLVAYIEARKAEQHEVLERHRKRLAGVAATERRPAANVSPHSNPFEIQCVPSRRELRARRRRSTR